jgi:fimbrial isopeptide formation D2 family protein/LPXTG-motif cell wall-anchored protein
VYFALTINLDDDLGEFESYYMAIDDELSKGLTFQQYEEIYVEDVGGHKIYLYKDGAWVVDAVNGINCTPSVNTQATGAQTRLDGTTVTAADSTHIVLGWDDLKQAFTNIAGDDNLVIKYSAKLNEDAVYGSAIPNNYFVKFNNGPKSDDYGYTNPDYAFVFSFGLKVNKVDADNTTNTLPGAEFLLYHMHGTQKFYAHVVNGEAVEWTPYVTDADIDAAKAAIDADTTLSDAEKTAAKAALKKATVLVTDINGAIHVDGLKESVLYFLHESKAPSGYNTLYSDVQVSIQPAYTTGLGGVPEVASITYIVDGATHTVNSGADFEVGRVVATVTNNKGNTLPSTGGFGTTMFYLIGGTMVAAAVVLLVTKKRMSVM